MISDGPSERLDRLRARLSTVRGTPETHYATSGDIHIAYQVTGDGPLDLVFMVEALAVDLWSDNPGFLRARKRLGAFSRTVWFEERGRGASEGDRTVPLDDDTFAADLGAVLDAVGCDRVALVATGANGTLAIRYTTMHPERVNALVLVNTFAHYVREDDYPWGVPKSILDRYVDLVREGWGTGAELGVLAPSQASDEDLRSWWARSARLRASPSQTANGMRASFLRDVRSVLPSISIPTLVLHREGDRFIHLRAGRYLAENIPGAKFVVLLGDEHPLFLGDTDSWVDEIEEFLTGVRSSSEGDVATATLLFTDIVASTRHQAGVGQRKWSRIMDDHDAMVRAALQHHRGREVKATGDGFLATFDATGRALRCAAEIVMGAKGFGLELRAGLHVGDIEIRGDDISGIPVSIAKRVCDLASSGEVFVSEAVRGLMAGSGIEFEDRGEHELKGLPGTWRLYSVAS